MDNEDALVGSMIRTIITNQASNNTTSKKELRNKHHLQTQNYNALIDLLISKLEEIDLKLVGIEGSITTDPKYAERYFITRANGNGRVRDFSTLINLITLIYLEGGRVGYDRLKHLMEQTGKTENYNDLIIYYKKIGYIQIYKEDDKIVVGFNWRYYAEFPDFDPIDLLKGVIIDKNE
ncbi:hypothetical protein TCON_1132 [Astathelohania contejeani]|uniref:Uncharacterized protein n=1 Tax=Astathelohania contejeani TaxID=164912 RepID=A0ABQ7HZV9_9MICR|nr:hypothetical protein TCON_1132 [Thelohania contejeani]